MEINHATLRKLIKRSFEVKQPLFISGATGIGKSEAVRTVFQEIAKEKERTFVEWSKLLEEDKISFMRDEGKLKDYLILVDDRVSLKDSTDNKGIPKLDHEYLKWVKTLIMNLSTKKDAMIIYFKDELNLATPSVMAAEYSIILDRALDDLSFAEDVYVLAAGNRQSDKANVFEIPPPLKNRFSHITLAIPTVEEWTAYALKHNVDERIIGFLNFQESALWKWKPDLKDDAFPTCRAWVALDKYIKDVKDQDLVKLYASAMIGDGTALEFVKFVELGMKINLDDYLENPKRLEKVTQMDMKYAIVSSAIERYRKKPDILPKFAKFIKYFNPEFSIYTLKMIRGTDDAIERNYFKTHIRKCDVWDIIKKEYAKFLV